MTLLRTSTRVTTYKPVRVRAFSLIELMIGIVILGLGLVMVATIFPVAWGRARTLSEANLHASIAETAESTVKALARVPGPLDTRLGPTGALASLKGNVASLAGDLMYDPRPIPPTREPIYSNRIDWPNDTWVHALNMENLIADVPQFVGEDPWRIEQAFDLSSLTPALNTDIIESSFLFSRIGVHQRVFPPLGSRTNVDASGQITGTDERWDLAFDSVRYCWSVLHRFRTRIPPFASPPPRIPPYTPEEIRALKAEHFESYAESSRLLDVFYVTLRRPQPTMRYPRQDPLATPDPYVLDPPQVVAPIALDSTQDVSLPVPWRVQIEILTTPASSGAPPLQSRTYDNFAFEPTGISTEARVPPYNGTDATHVDLFTEGTRFIDEITGQIFTVISRRLTTPDGDQAVLTLDREILVEDIDLTDAADPRCPVPACAPVKDQIAGGGVPEPDPAELLRTVWVFPPPVEAGTRNAGDPLVFDGNQPVVDISVRTLTLAPLR